MAPTTLMDDVRKLVDKVERTSVVRQRNFDNLLRDQESWREEVLCLPFAQSVEAASAASANYTRLKERGWSVLRRSFEEYKSFFHVTDAHEQLVAWVSLSNVEPTLDLEERAAQVAALDTIVRAIVGVMTRMIGTFAMMNEFANTLKVWRDRLEVELKPYCWSSLSREHPSVSDPEWSVSANLDMNMLLISFITSCRIRETLQVHVPFDTFKRPNGSPCNMVTLTDLWNTVAQMESVSNSVYSDSDWRKHIGDVKVALSNAEKHVKKCYPKLSQPCKWSDFYVMGLRTMLLSVKSETNIAIADEEVRESMRGLRLSELPF